MRPAAIIRKVGRMATVALMSAIAIFPAAAGTRPDAAVAPAGVAAAAGWSPTAWSDAEIGQTVAQGRLSGAAVAVIEHGKVVFSKGYGHDGRSPVTPNGTLFSIGSITKSFTATAIAQLVEAGKIRSIDDPANLYLKRHKLPVVFGRTIRIRDLLTHRAGFDDSIYGLATPVRVQIPLSSKAIGERLPPIVRKPGEISVYSNSGYGVLGLMIEDITGETYSDYISRHILAPLGMAHSYVRTAPDQPIAEPMTSHAGGAATPIPQHNWAYHPFILPSAGIVSTAEDMARMAQAQLAAEHGTVPGIVKPALARRMHEPLTRNAPGASAFGYSFILTEWNGQRVVENEGSGPGFQANFVLLPGRDTALVTVMMGDRENGAGLNMFSVRQSFLEAVLGKWKPAETSVAPSADVSRYAGLYRATRRPSASVETVLSPGEIIDVEVGPAGSLTINGHTGYREIAPGQFWRSGVVPYVPDAAASDLYSFVTSPDGKVRFVTNRLAVEVFEPVSVTPDQMQLVGMVGLGGVLAGLAGLFWRPDGRRRKIARWLAVGVAGSAALFAAGIFAGPLLFGNPMFTWAFADRRMFLWLMAAGNLVLVLTIALALAFAWCLLAADRPGRLRGLWLAIVVLGGGAMSAALGYYNVLGYHLP